MVQLLSTIVIFFSTTSLMAQGLIFAESFDDNHRKWPMANDSSHVLAIEDGAYVFHHKREKGYWCAWQSLFIGTEDDFRIESSMVHKKGAENMPFGLVWGAKNTRNMNCFLISNSGYYRIVHYTNGKFNSYSGKWKQTTALRSNSLNLLTIEKKKDSVQFYINNELVFRDKKRSFYGGKVGFVVHGNNNIHFDNLDIYQDQPIYMANLTHDWSKKHLGKQVNSSSPELNPVVSHDGQYLFFDREEHPKNYGKQKKDDIWYSKREGKKWSNAILMERPINNEDHNGIISVSPDNMSLFVMNKYRTDSTYATSGFSLTHMTDTGWAYPTPVEVEGYYNTNKYTSSCMSPNNKTIIMSLERTDGYGDLDLYVSFEHGDQFTIPLNLGPQINTYLSDGTPFLSADGKTLFFSSKGHYGYGSYDVFMSKRLDDSWTKWSKPVNLGPQVNSPNWDAYFTITADGKSAFMTSNQPDSYGSIDIYSMVPPKDIRPEQTLSIAGQVINARSKQFMVSNIYYYDVSTNKEIGKAKSAPQTGRFKLIVPQEHDYKVYAYMEGFFPTSQFIKQDSLREKKEYDLDLTLHPIMINETIPIHLSNNEMGKLVRIMDLYPDMRIQVNGPNQDRLVVTNYLKANDLVSYRYNKKGLASDDVSFTILHLGDKKSLNEETAIFDDELSISDIQIGQKFKVPSIYFDADSIQFKPVSKASLNDVIQFLEQYPSVQIEIGGHTNGLPSHAYCDRLSSLRAKAVRNYILSNGVPASRVIAKGYGKRQNVASNETEKGRLKNQRVEIKILTL